ncbi:MAG: aspartyl protease family protein [candidate division WOR-3 bacterium]
MGLFSVRVKVKSLAGRTEASVNALVDTGASLSVIPGRVLEKLGVERRWRRKFVLANGEKVERDVGVVIFAWNGREGAAEVIFGEPGDKSLIGALTLETLGLKVNHRRGCLEPIELMLL